MAQNVLSDAVEAFTMVLQISWRRNLNAWVFVPTGLILILLACFGLDSLIGMSDVSFPASVACMVILFFALVLSDLVLGNKKTKAIVGVVDIPTSFALRYISLFFTPSFVLLPLSPSIGGIEVVKIIAVFIIGFVVIFAATAYSTRGIQLLLGSSKRAITERAEEMGQENDSIPLSEITVQGQNSETSRPQSPHTPREELSQILNRPPSPEISRPQSAYMPGEEPTQIFNTPPSPPKTPPALETKDVEPEVKDFGTAENSSGFRTAEGSIQEPMPAQAPVELTRPQTWAAFMNRNIDRIIWSIVLLVGIPVYYATGYAMPEQLSINILAYFAALSLPTKWKRFLHPVLVSSLITVLTIWILGLIRGQSLHQVLEAYKTGSNYLKLWHNGRHSKPGAADLIDSLLDASIVSFALPMFHYRRDLVQHFFAIVIPNIVISVASLFGYPALCYAIGISSKRSLSFAARSVTLALATPAVKNLGGDPNTVAACVIMSGILGGMFGLKLLHWMRIPHDDYVTRGVTLGGNSSAIGTALLLVSDPRAAALSSLSMSLFGVITVVLTSVPPIVNAVLHLVGE